MKISLGLKSCLASALLCTVDIDRCKCKARIRDRKRHGAPGGVLFSNRSFERHAKEVRARRCLMFDLCLVFNSRHLYELGEGTRTHRTHHQAHRQRHPTARPVGSPHRTDRTPRATASARPPSPVLRSSTRSEVFEKRGKDVRGDGDGGERRETPPGPQDRRTPASQDPRMP